MTATKHSHFRSHNHTSPVFTCGICKKQTRDTGHDEAALELCKRCLFKCYVDNAKNDYGKDSDEYREALKNLNALKKEARQ